MHRNIFITIIIYFISILLNCSENDKNNYYIQTIDKCKFIVNSNRPSNGFFEYELIEDLVIGSDVENINYQFNAPTNFKIMENGDIYILDSGDKNIKVYNKYGEHKFTFGKKGQGPGEFLNPNSLSVIPDKKIFILDNSTKQISCFDSLGHFYHSFRLTDGFWFSNLECNQHNILFSTYKRDDTGKNFMELVKYGLNGVFQKKIGKFETISLQKIPVEIKGGTTVVAISSGYEPTDSWTTGPAGNIYVGFSKKYEISAYSIEGRLLYKFRKENDLQRIEKDEIKQVLNYKSLKNIPSSIKENITFPEYKPAFWKIVCVDSQNNVWIKIPHDQEKNGKCIYDVFDSTGIYIRQIFMNYDIQFVTKNYFYGFYRDSNDITLFKRLKLK